MSTVAGGGQFLLNGGWAYWPISDYYSLVPKWEESHSITGVPVNPDEEPNRYDLVAGYHGEPPFLIVKLTEDNPETEDVVEEAVPAGTPLLSGRVWVPEGFATEYPLTLDLVTDDLDEDPETDETWNGEIRILFPEVARRAIGPNRVANFVFDLGFVEDPYVSIRLAFGTVVFRR